MVRAIVRHWIVSERMPHPEARECYLDSFLSENDDLDDDTLARVASLGVGDRMHIGGGASPLVVVERVS